MANGNKNKAVEEVKSTAVAQYDYSEYAGQGFENHSTEDYSVPFLGLLQSNSPLVESSADAKAGMIYNTVTQELYDGKDGVVFIPCATDHKFVEWVTRNQGGGFVAVHELDSDVVKKVKSEQEFGKYKMIKGDIKSNDLIETFYVYGLLVANNGTAQELIIAFTSTKNRIYKQWMTKARTIQIVLPNSQRIAAPLFAHKYRITSVSQKNADGTFYNFSIGYDGKSAEECRLDPNDSLVKQAKNFYEFFKSGKVKAANETQVAGNSESEEQTPFK